MLNIVFMGTPNFARESLEAVYNAKYNILGVVTNTDKPKGRGMNVVASAVKEYAQSKNLTIYQPEKIRGNEEFIKNIKDLNPDVICVVAYGKILPKEILEIPKLGCINVHGSLLPKYRGAAPIQWAIINGEEETGITTMYMDIGMDTGDMILKEKIEIEPNETTGELWDRLSKIGGQLLVETLKQIEDGTVKRQKQGQNYTMAPMLDKEISKIDWNSSSKQIKNLVRGLNPIMGAYAINDNKKIKFWTVDIITQEELLHRFEEFSEYSYKLDSLENGTILISDDKKGLYIKVKDGILNVLEVQGENAKKMSINEFLRGNKLYIGSILK